MKIIEVNQKFITKEIKISALNQPIYVWFRVNEMYKYNEEFSLNNDFELKIWNINNQQTNTKIKFDIIQDKKQKWIRVNEPIHKKMNLYITFKFPYPCLKPEKNSFYFLHSFTQLCEMYNYNEDIETSKIHLNRLNSNHDLELQFIQQKYPEIYKFAEIKKNFYTIPLKAIYDTTNISSLIDSETKTIDTEKLKRLFNLFVQLLQKPLSLTLKLYGKNIDSDSYEIKS